MSDEILTLSLEKEPAAVMRVLRIIRTSEPLGGRHIVQTEHTIETVEEGVEVYAAMVRYATDALVLVLSTTMDQQDAKMTAVEIAAHMVNQAVTGQVGSFREDNIRTIIEDRPHG